MRFGALPLVWSMLVAPAMASDPGILVLRHLATLQSGLAENQVEDLEKHRSDMRAILVRLNQQQAALLSAQEQGESIDSLRLRDEEMRGVEAALMAHILEGQRLRQALIGSRTLIAEAEEEIQRLEQRGGRAADPITGTWHVVLEPGGQEGEFTLRLDGTLVMGTYVLDGGWGGSLRGTFVAGKVRLERIDAQIGFAAIFYGQLVFEDEKPRIQGRWEATQLSSGLTPAGAWVADRQ